jgi:ketosteroid isomerase-like protein
MIFCNQCGSSVAEGLYLCPECGTPLPVASPSATVSLTPSRAGAAQPPPASGGQATTAGALPARTSNTALIICVTTISTLLVVGIGFIGARTWLKDSQAAAIGQNTETSLSHRNNEPATKTEPAPPTPPPTRPSATQQYSPPAQVDTSTARQEVVSALNRWVAALRARDFNGEISYYADNLDVYYSRRNVAVDFVRELHLKLFSKYSTTDMQLTNINVDVSQSGLSAVATFDKTFNFQGEKNYSGAVLSHFEWTKINGTWRITGDKDLKIYYVNKEK